MDPAIWTDHLPTL